MPVFEYTARDGAGQQSRGSVEAASNTLAAAQLRERGLWVSELRPLKAAGSPGAPAAPRSGTVLQPLYTGVSAKDRALFYRQLTTMMAAGMPIYQSLSTLASQTPNRRLASVLNQMSQAILAGSSFTGAMTPHAGMFSSMEIRMVEAGETGGMLDSVLGRLADYLEREYMLRMKIKQRMLYPFLLLLAFIFIPKVPILVLQGPAPYFISIATTWGSIAVGFALTVMIFRYLLKSEAFRDLYDQIKLAIPGIGGLVRKMAIGRFARAFAALYHAGIPAGTGLVVAAEAAGNSALLRGVYRIAPAVQSGASLAQSVTQLRFFPPMFTGMIATGEQTGNLDTMLDKSAEYYESEASHSAQQMVVVLGVALLLIMALLIAIQVVGFYSGMANQVGGAAGE